MNHFAMAPPGCSRRAPAYDQHEIHQQQPWKLSWVTLLTEEDYCPGLQMQGNNSMGSHNIYYGMFVVGTKGAERGLSGEDQGWENVGLGAKMAGFR